MQRKWFDRDLVLILDKYTLFKTFWTRRLA